MSRNPQEVRDDLATRLTKADEHFQQTMKSIIIGHDGPQGPVAYRFIIGKNGTEYYLQDTISKHKEKINEDFARLMNGTGVIGFQDNTKSQSLKK